MKSKYKIRGITSESYREVNKHVMTHVRRILGIPQRTYTAYNMELDDVHLAIHKTKNNSTDRYIVVAEDENIKEHRQEYVDMSTIKGLTPVFEDPNYLKIDSYNKKVKRKLTIEFRSGEENEIKSIVQNLTRLTSKGSLQLHYDLDSNVLKFLDHVRATKDQRLEITTTLDQYIPVDKRTVTKWSTYDIKLRKSYPIKYQYYEYILKVDVDVVYNRDLLLFIDHTVLFNNKILHDLYMKSRGRLGMTSNLNIVKELGSAYSTYLTNQDDNFNIPITDDFVPSTNDEKYKALATIVLPIGKDKQTLGNLNDLPGLYIKQHYIDYIISKREDTLDNYKGLFTLELYENLNLTDKVLTLEADGTIKANKELDITKIYRLTFKRLKELTSLEDAEQALVTERFGEIDRILIYLNSAKEEKHNLTKANRAWLDRYGTELKIETLEKFAALPKPINYWTGDLPRVLGDIIQNDWSIDKPTITSEGYNGTWLSFKGILDGSEYTVQGRYPGKLSSSEWIFANSGLEEVPNLEDPNLSAIKIPTTTLNIKNLPVLQPNKKVYGKVRYVSEFEEYPLESKWSEPFMLDIPDIGFAPIQIQKEIREGKLIVSATITPVENNKEIVGPIVKKIPNVIIKKGDQIIATVPMENNRAEIPLVGYEPGDDYTITVEQGIKNEWLNSRGIESIKGTVPQTLTDDDIPFIVNPEWSIVKPTITSDNYNSNSPASTLDNFTGVVKVSAYQDTHDYPGEYSKTIFRIAYGENPSFANEDEYKTIEQDTDTLDIKYINVIKPNSKVWIQAKHKSEFAKHPLESDWSDTFIVNIPNIGLKPITITPSIVHPNLKIDAPIELLEDNPRVFLGDISIGNSILKLLKGEAEIVNVPYNNLSALVALDLLEENTDYKIVIETTIVNAWLNNQGLDKVKVEQEYHLGEKPFIIDPDWKINKPVVSANSLSSDFETFTGKVDISPYAVTASYPGPHTGTTISVSYIGKTDEGIDQEPVITTIEEMLDTFNVFDKQFIKSDSKLIITAKHSSNFVKHPLESEVSESLTITVPKLGIKDITVNKEVEGDRLKLTIDVTKHFGNTKLDTYGTNEVTNLQASIMLDTVNTPIELQGNVGYIDLNQLEENREYTITVSAAIDNAYLKRIGVDSKLVTLTHTKVFEANPEWAIEQPVITAPSYMLPDIDGGGHSSVSLPTEDEEDFGPIMPVAAMVGNVPFMYFDGTIVASPYKVKAGYPGPHSSSVYKLTMTTHTETGDRVNEVEVNDVLGNLDLYEKKLIKSNTDYSITLIHKSDFQKHPLESIPSEALEISVPPIGVSQAVMYKHIEGKMLKFDIRPEFEYSSERLEKYGNEVTVKLSINLNDDQYTDIPLNEFYRGELDTDQLEVGKVYKFKIVTTINNTYLQELGLHEVTQIENYTLDERPFIPNPSWKINKPTITVNSTDAETFNGKFVVSDYSVVDDYPGTMSNRFLKLKILDRTASTDNIDWDSDFSVIEMNSLEHNLFNTSDIPLGKKCVAMAKYSSDFEKHPLDSEWSDVVVVNIPNPVLDVASQAVVYDDDKQMIQIPFTKRFVEFNESLCGADKDERISVKYWEATKGEETAVVVEDGSIIDNKANIPYASILEDVQYNFAIEYSTSNPWYHENGVNLTKANGTFTKVFVANPLWKVVKPTLSTTNEDTEDFDLNIATSPYAVEADYPGVLGKRVLVIVKEDIDTTDAITTLTEHGQAVTVELNEDKFDLYTWDQFEVGKQYRLQFKHTANHRLKALESEWSDIKTIKVLAPTLTINIDRIENEDDQEQIKIVTTPTYTNMNKRITGTDRTGDTVITMVAGDQNVNVVNGMANKTDVEYNTPYTINVTYTSNNEWLKQNNKHSVTANTNWTRVFPTNSNWAINKPTVVVNNETLEASDVNTEVYNGIIKASDYTVVENYPGQADKVHVELYKLTNANDIASGTKYKDLSYTEIANGINIFEQGELEPGQHYAVKVKYESTFKYHPLSSEWSDPWYFTLPTPDIEVTVGEPVVTFENVTIPTTVSYKGFNKHLNTDIQTGTVTISLASASGTVQAQDGVVDINSLTTNEDYNIEAIYNTNNEYYKEKGKADVRGMKSWTLTNKPLNPAWSLEKPVITVSGNNIATFDGLINVTPYQALGGYTGVKSNLKLAIAVMELNHVDNTSGAYETYDDVKMVDVTTEPFNLFNWEHYVPGKKYGIKAKYESNYDVNKLESEWSDGKLITMINATLDLTIEETDSKLPKLNIPAYKLDGIDNEDITSVEYIVKKDNRIVETVVDNSTFTNNYNQPIAIEIPSDKYLTWVDYNLAKQLSFQVVITSTSGSLATDIENYTTTAVYNPGSMEVTNNPDNVSVTVTPGNNPATWIVPSKYKLDIHKVENDELVNTYNKDSMEAIQVPFTDLTKSVEYYIVATITTNIGTYKVGEDKLTKFKFENIGYATLPSPVVDSDTDSIAFNGFSKDNITFFMPIEEGQPVTVEIVLDAIVNKDNGTRIENIKYGYKDGKITILTYNNIPTGNYDFEVSVKATYKDTVYDMPISNGKIFGTIVVNVPDIEDIQRVNLSINEQQVPVVKINPISVAGNTGMIKPEYNYIKDVELTVLANGNEIGKYTPVFSDVTEITEDVINNETIATSRTIVIPSEKLAEWFSKDPTKKAIDTVLTVTGTAGTRFETVQLESNRVDYTLKLGVGDIRFGMVNNGNKLGVYAEPLNTYGADWVTEVSNTFKLYKVGSQDEPRVVKGENVSRYAVFDIASDPQGQEYYLILEVETSAGIVKKGEDRSIRVTKNATDNDILVNYAHRALGDNPNGDKSLLLTRIDTERDVIPLEDAKALGMTDLKMTAKVVDGITGTNVFETVDSTSTIGDGLIFNIDRMEDLRPNKPYVIETTPSLVTASDSIMLANNTKKSFFSTKPTNKVNILVTAEQVDNRIDVNFKNTIVDTTDIEVGKIKCLIYHNGKVTKSQNLELNTLEGTDINTGYSFKFQVDDIATWQEDKVIDGSYRIEIRIRSQYGVLIGSESVIFKTQFEKPVLEKEHREDQKDYKLAITTVPQFATNQTINIKGYTFEIRDSKREDDIVWSHTATVNDNSELVDSNYLPMKTLMPDTTYQLDVTIYTDKQDFKYTAPEEFSIVTPLSPAIRTPRIHAEIVNEEWVFTLQDAEVIGSTETITKASWTIVNKTTANNVLEVTESTGHYPKATMPTNVEGHFEITAKVHSETLTSEAVTHVLKLAPIGPKPMKMVAKIGPDQLPYIELDPFIIENGIDEIDEAYLSVSTDDDSTMYNLKRVNEPQKPIEYGKPFTYQLSSDLVKKALGPGFTEGRLTFSAYITGYKYNVMDVSTSLMFKPTYDKGNLVVNKYLDNTNNDNRVERLLIKIDGLNTHGAWWLYPDMIKYKITSAEDDSEVETFDSIGRFSSNSVITWPTTKTVLDKKYNIEVTLRNHFEAYILTGTYDPAVGAPEFDEFVSVELEDTRAFIYDEDLLLSVSKAVIKNPKPDEYGDIVNHPAIQYKVIVRDGEEVIFTDDITNNFNLENGFKREYRKYPVKNMSNDKIYDVDVIPYCFYNNDFVKVESGKVNFKVMRHTPERIIDGEPAKYDKDLRQIPFITFGTLEAEKYDNESKAYIKLPPLEVDKFTSTFKIGDHEEVFTFNQKATTLEQRIELEKYISWLKAYPEESSINVKCRLENDTYAKDKNISIPLYPTVNTGSLTIVRPTETEGYKVNLSGWDVYGADWIDVKETVLRILTPGNNKHYELVKTGLVTDIAIPNNVKFTNGVRYGIELDIVTNIKTYTVKADILETFKGIDDTTPELIQPTVSYDLVDGKHTVIGSPFRVMYSDEQHVSTSWRVTEVGTEEVIKEVNNDTENLTKLEVELTKDVEYKVTMKYHGATMESEVVTTTFRRITIVPTKLRLKETSTKEMEVDVSAYEVNNSVDIAKYIEILYNGKVIYKHQVSNNGRTVFMLPNENLINLWDDEKYHRPVDLQARVVGEKYKTATGEAIYNSTLEFNKGIIVIENVGEEQPTIYVDNLNTNASWLTIDEINFRLFNGHNRIIHEASATVADTTFKLPPSLEIDSYENYRVECDVISLEKKYVLEPKEFNKSTAPHIVDFTLSSKFKNGYVIIGSPYEAKHTTLEHTATTWKVNRVDNGNVAEEVYSAIKDKVNLRKLVIKELPVGEYEVSAKYYNAQMGSKVITHRFTVHAPSIGDITLTVEKAEDQLPLLSITPYIPNYTVETLEGIKLTMIRDDETRTITLPTSKFKYTQAGASYKLTANQYSYMFKDGKPVQPITYKARYISKSLSSKESEAVYNDMATFDFGELDISGLASQTAKLSIVKGNYNGSDQWVRILESKWTYLEKTNDSDPGTVKELPLIIGNAVDEYPLEVEDVFTEGHTYEFRCTVETNVGTYVIRPLTMKYAPVVGTITAPTVGHTYTNGKLELQLGEFTSTLPTEEHTHTSLKIVRTDFDSLVYEIKTDGVQRPLTKVTLPDRLISQNASEYKVTVRYHSKNLVSDAAEYTFSTIARSLDPVNVTLEDTDNQLGKLTISPYKDKIGTDTLAYMEYYILKGDTVVTTIRDDSVVGKTDEIVKVITIEDVKVWLNNNAPSETNKLEGTVDILPVLYGNLHKAVGNKVSYTFKYNMNFGPILIKGVKDKAATLSTTIGSAKPDYLTINSIDWVIKKGDNTVATIAGVTDPGNEQYGKLTVTGQDAIYDGHVHHVEYVVKTNIGTYINGKNGEYFFRYTTDPVTDEKNRLDLNFNKNTAKVRKYKKSNN